MSVRNIRRKVERGILGIPKKKTVLFSFNPRKGEECLSDSEDSDYYPGRRSTDDEDEDTYLNKSKRKVKKAAKNSQAQPKTKRRRREDLSREERLANGSEILQFFPPEILIKIFHFGLQLESAVKFIPRVSRVCQAWHKAATDPMLWIEIDLPCDVLALTRSNLDKFLKKDVSCCRILNLSGQNKLSEANIETALRSMPSLTSLDLSDCTNVKTELLPKISEICPRLKRFKLCFTDSFNGNIKATGLETFIGSCGSNLVELRLTRITALKSNTRQIFTAIEERCPNLEILDLRVTDVVKCITPGKKFDFDADTFFSKIHKLSELRLDGFNVITQRHAPAEMNGGGIHLKNLQIYTHGHQMYQHPDRPIFYRMFGSTAKLHHLDISSSNLLPGQIVSYVTEVTELTMSDMRWRDSDHMQVVDCLEAWKLNLKRLDLSQNIFVHSALDGALMLYSGPEEHYPLQYLNLRSTNITVLPLICVLRNCTDLREVDLTSSRNLPRGCKRLFIQTEFQALIEKLEEALEDVSD